jgi:hypothetical protein
LDGTYQVNNEYNEDIPVSLPAGRHLIEIRNVGGDWFYLDWVRLVNVLPSRYAGGWEPSPVAVGVRAEKETLLYVVSPQVNFPANATNATIEPLIGASLRVRHLPAGRYQAFWSEPRTAVAVGETTGRSDGVELVLPLPPFTEDLAGRLLTAADFGFTPPLAPAPRRFQTSLYGEPGHHYRVEISDQLTAWTPWLTLTNLAGAVSLEDSSPTNLSRRFYRARLAE